MLDLRQTSSTSAFRQIINRRRATALHPEIHWHRAHEMVDLDDDGIGFADKRELELFGGSYSLSSVITKAQSLAPGRRIVTKPLSIYINALDHAAPEPVAQKDNIEDDSEDQLAALAMPKPKNNLNIFHSKIYGTITANRRIDTASVVTAGANSDPSAAYRASIDSIMGGKTIAKPALKKVLEDDGESDWGEEGEEEKETIKWKKIRSRASLWGKQVIFGPYPRPEIRVPPQRLSASSTTDTDLMLLRHLPLLTPTLSSTSTSTTTLTVKNLAAGAPLTRKRPNALLEGTKLYSPAPSKVPRLSTPVNRTITPSVRRVIPPVRPEAPLARVWTTPSSVGSIQRPPHSSSSTFSQNSASALASARSVGTSNLIQRSLVVKDTREPQRRSTLAAFRKR
jgi:hypothetical protein